MVMSVLDVRWRWGLLLLLTLAFLPARAQPPRRHRSESYRKVAPALVKIYNYRWSTKNDKPSTASGFIIDEAGHVLTNYHVVRDARQLHVRHVKYDQKYYDIGLDHVDPERDIAILHLKDFKGFRKEGSTPDASARPIDIQKARRIKDPVEALDLELNVLSNPVHHTDIFAPGFVTGYKDIGEVLAPVAKPGSKPARSGYDILELTNTVAPGSSGGLVVDETSGRMVGMVFGADRHEHLAFVLPAALLQKHLEEARLPPGPHEARHSLEFARSDQDGRNTDEYYKSYLFQRGTRDSEQELEELDGTLLTPSHGKIPGGRVWAVGKRRGCHEKLHSGMPLENPLECNFSQIVTTEVAPQGTFQLAVPIDSSLEWTFHAEHRAYDMKAKGPFFNHEFLQYYTMTLKPEYYRKSNILYADQRIIELKWGMAEPEVNLDSTSDPIAWEMHASNTSWLKVDPTKGRTRRNSRPIKLRYVLTGERALDPKTFTTLVFSPSTNTNEIAEAIDVYAGHIPDDEYFYFDGVVYVDGLPAVPYENVSVTAHVGDKQVSVRVEDSGRFQLRLKRKDVAEQVVLRVTGESFEDAHEAGLAVKPTQPGTAGKLVQLKVRIKQDSKPVVMQ